MSKTSLAYIDRRIDFLLASETKNPTAHVADSTEAAKPRQIAGFKVADSNKTNRMMEAALEKRRGVVATYLKAKRELAEEYAALGVKPEAIIPTETFLKICRDTDMYFVPKKMRAQINPAHFLIYMKTPATQSVEQAVIDSSQWTGMRTPSDSKRALRTAAKTRSVEAYREEYSHDTIMRHLLSTMTHDTIMRHLLSTMTSEDQSRVWGRDVTIARQMFASPIDGQGFELELPDPPEDICVKLRTLGDADIDLQTVAVYGAMNFVGGVASVLAKAFYQHREEEQAIIDWRLNDPIVYDTRGPVTAVVCQFGPFPVEQAVIDRITASDFLPASI